MRLSSHPHVFVDRSGQHRIPCETGWFSVPEVRSKQGSRPLEVAWCRFPSTSRDPGPPLVVLEGGPGAPGLETCALIPERYLLFRELGDVIALDQRGVGLSRPNLTSPYRLDLPLDRAIDEDDFLAEAQDKVALAVEFWVSRGIDLSGYTTDENADDVAELMTALGYESFRTYGGSYGSHLSLAVIRRHGHRLDRSYICMVEGPDDTYKLPSSSDAHLGRLADLAAAAPELEGCVPDLVGLMKHVFERLREEPVTIDGVVLGDFDVRYLTAMGMGDGDFLRALPSLFLAAEVGDLTWWAPRVRRLRNEPVSNLMSLVMDCASGASPERLARIEAEAGTAVLGELVNFPFPQICATVGGPDAGAAFRQPVASEVRTLFASGSLDGRTPPSNAEAVMAGFPNSHHILVENAAHRWVHDDPVVFDAVRDFMAGRPVTLDRTTIDFVFDAPPKVVR